MSDELSQNLHFQIFGHWTLGRGFHAQASSKAQVFVRAKRQSVLLLGEKRIRVTNLLHDT